jgi:hypothetical protein
MVPLVEFPHATEQEKTLITECNNLKLSNSVNYENIDAYRHQFLALLEEHSITIKKDSKRYGEQCILSEGEFKTLLKGSRSILQNKFETDYPNWERCYCGEVLASKYTDQLIEFYIKIRPQLIQNGIEKEYFTKRLDVLNKKIQDLRTLQAEQLLIMNLHYINTVVKEEKKKEEEIDAFLNGDFKKTYKQLAGVTDAIPKFLDLQKKYPNYQSRNTFIENEDKSLFKLYSIIYNRTGFEPDFAELCCCASETPTEVLQIIYDKTCYLMHAHKTL